VELKEYLGKEVKDVASGFTGIAIQVIEYLSGVTQVGIQPKSEGGNYPDAYTIDTNLVDIVGPGISDRVVPPNPDDFTGMKLGDTLRDKASKITGVATHKSTFMNGCVTVMLTGEVKTGSDKPPRQEWINARMLEKVEKEPVKPKEGRSGGPSMKACRPL
jgi:hypothetical protein